MNSVDSHWTVLVAHPGTAREPVSGIAVEVRRATASTLVCNYSLHGEIAKVRVAGGKGGSADGLWQHTCFEAFIAVAGVPGYYEFNFSPTLAWAAYRFSDYRAGMAPASLSKAPGLQVTRGTDRLELAATVHLAGLAGLAESPPLRLGLSAVIEDHRGRLGYWALEHPPGKPDFHHPDNFLIELHAL